MNVQLKSGYDAGRGHRHCQGKSRLDLPEVESGERVLGQRSEVRPDRRAVLLDGFRRAGVPDPDLVPMAAIGVFVIEGLLMHPHLLNEGLRQLAAGGATVALLASASVHVAFERIRSDSPVPLIDMVVAAVQASEGHRRLGLFATSFTAKADLFGPAFRAVGKTVVTPTDAEQEEVHRIYFDELVRGQFLTRSRARLLDIAQRMQADENIDGVLLAGTELPLLLPESAYGGVRFIDTGRAHVDAAVRAMLDKDHANTTPA